MLWLYHPSQLWVLDHLADRACLVVYDWTDDWVEAYPDHLPAGQKDELQQCQQILLERSDLVFAVSKALCQRASKFCDAVFHLPNATDPRVFKPLLPGQPLDPMIKGMPGPCLAYLSQITERLDVDLVADLAERRPAWQFLMIGPEVCAKGFLARLKQLKNIWFTGSLPYHEAARLLAQARVSILPHKVDRLTQTLDPIKLYDYLAVGNPVVTTPVAMNTALAPYVRVASGSDRFEAAVVASLEEGPSPKAERRAAAMAHIWERRRERAVQILERFY